MSATNAPHSSCRLGYGLLGLLCIILAGCASAPPPPVTHNELYTYAEQQLEQAIALDRLATICRDLLNTDQSEAGRLYQDWLTTEWPVVAGADSYYRSTQSNKTMSFDGQTLSMDALSFYSDRLEKINANFGYLMRVKTDPSRLCERKMTENINKVALSDRVKRRLLEYGQQHVSAPAPGTRVPSLAGDFTIVADPGRSYYNVEQSSRSANCPNVKIVTFKNEWPQEIYGAFCGDSHQLISCDWGKCRRL